AREAYVKFAEGLYEGNNLRRAAEVYAMLGEEQKAQELAEEEARRYEDSLDRGSYGGTSSDYEAISQAYQRAGNSELSDRYSQLAQESKTRYWNHQASIAESFGEFYRAMNYYVDASNQEKAREAARKVIDAAEQLTGVTPD